MINPTATATSTTTSTGFFGGPENMPLSPTLENKSAVLRALWNQTAKREADRVDYEVRKKTRSNRYWGMMWDVLRINMKAV
jgi:hypothetical protein